MPRSDLSLKINSGIIVELVKLETRVHPWLFLGLSALPYLMGMFILLLKDLLILPMPLYCIWNPPDLIHHYISPVLFNCFPYWSPTTSFSLCIIHSVYIKPPMSFQNTNLITSHPGIKPFMFLIPLKNTQNDLQGSNNLFTFYLSICIPCYQHPWLSKFWTLLSSCHRPCWFCIRLSPGLFLLPPSFNQHPHFLPLPHETSLLLLLFMPEVSYLFNAYLPGWTVRIQG